MSAFDMNSLRSQPPACAGSAVERLTPVLDDNAHGHRERVLATERCRLPKMGKEPVNQLNMIGR